jgi:hypothetical protein
MTEQERLDQWYSRLHTEWLTNWVDLPENLFAWWNLLVVATEDAEN